MFRKTWILCNISFTKIWTLVCNHFIRRGVFFPFPGRRPYLISRADWVRLFLFRRTLSKQPVKMPFPLLNIFIHPLWWMKEDFLASNKTTPVYPAHSITLWLSTWCAASNIQPTLGCFSSSSWHFRSLVTLKQPPGKLVLEAPAGATALKPE